MNKKLYIDSDVYTEAKKRIHHVFEAFDSVIVNFSGGKDSLCLLHLTREVMHERGVDPVKVNVIFYDEEVIPQSVIDFVNIYRVKDWIKMYYLAVPLNNTKFVLGKNFNYVAWDPQREHMRPIPAHAIRQPEGDNTVYDQYTLNGFTSQFFKGKIAYLTGIRASESLYRLRASINKVNENYITATTFPNVCLCKPLYDWEENDIFKYFFENEIEYCEIYDAQHLCGESLRVSTPLHAESAKRLDRVKERDPQFFNRVMQLFPEMRVQERYWNEYDRKSLLDEYGHSFAKIREYINTQIDEPSQRAKALKRLHSVFKRAKSKPEAYPPEHVFTYIHGGSYNKRECLPLDMATQKRFKERFAHV